MNLKQIFHILHRPRPGTRYVRPVSIFLTALIVVNCLPSSIETVRSIYTAHTALFHTLEIVSTVIFAIEYLLRGWTCVVQLQFAAPFRGSLRYIVGPQALLGRF